MPREREREIYARRPGIVLQHGIVGRVPWCKDYTEPLPFIDATHPGGSTKHRSAQSDLAAAGERRNAGNIFFACGVGLML